MGVHLMGVQPSQGTHVKVSDFEDLKIFSFWEKFPIRLRTPP